MKLGILDRVLISQVLPGKGSMVDVLTIKDIRSKIDISKEEREEVGLIPTQDGNALSWDKELEKDIELSSAEKNLILDAFKKLDEEKELTIQLAETYIKLKGM